MAHGGGLLDRVFQQRRIWRWARASAGTHPVALRKHKHQPPLWRSRLGGLIPPAEEHLAMPCGNADDLPRPYNADWAWRPELWRGPLPVTELRPAHNRAMFGNEITVFHDCTCSGPTLRQLQNSRDEGPARCGLRMDVSRFDGSFLSLVVDLPKQAILGLKRTHLLRLDAIVEIERPMKIFARVNVKHGPDTEQVVRELPLPNREAMVEFDLAYTELREKRVEKAWIDLIFDQPETNRVMLRDLALSRRPRAAF